MDDLGVPHGIVDIIQCQFLSSLRLQVPIPKRAKFQPIFWACCTVRFTTFRKIGLILDGCYYYKFTYRKLPYYFFRIVRVQLFLQFLLSDTQILLYYRLLKIKFTISYRLVQNKHVIVRLAFQKQDLPVLRLVKLHLKCIADR